MNSNSPLLELRTEKILCEVGSMMFAVIPHPKFHEESLRQLDYIFDKS